MMSSEVVLVKLVYCPACDDAVKFSTAGEPSAHCRCGRSWGAYNDGENATYGGDAIALGLSNSGLVRVMESGSPPAGYTNGGQLTGWAMPLNSDTCVRVSRHRVYPPGSYSPDGVVAFPQYGPAVELAGR